METRAVEEERYAARLTMVEEGERGKLRGDEMIQGSHWRTETGK